MEVFSDLFGRLLFQLYYTIGKWRAADADGISEKEKIPISVSSVVLMIVTITYKLVLVMLGLFVLFFQPRITDTYMQNVMPVMWLGLWLNVFCVTFMLLLTFHPQLMRQILVKGHEVLVKMHILKKRPPVWKNWKMPWTSIRRQQNI